MSARFPSLNVVGGMFAAELIDDIAEGVAEGQRPRDFGLPEKTRLLDEISRAWSEARGYWSAFRRRLDALPCGETGATVTRTQWLVPLLELLDYELVYQERAAEVDGQTYAISHRAGRDDSSPPVHIVGARQSLDRRPESGRPRLAPHSLVQEYLNRTEHLWGIVTNGLTLRLLRDSQLMRRQAYLEFDLRTMFEGEQFADFALFYRILHRTRLPRAGEDPAACLLERWHKQTEEQGGRVREKLRDGVEKAIEILANGLLAHPRNTELRAKIEMGKLKAPELYQQLLRLIYRLLFLMVTEERNLLCANPIYREHYSISRLRRLAEIPQARNQQEDLWQGLQSTFRLFHSEQYGGLLQAPPLDGELFDLSRTQDLNSCCLTNRDLLSALWHLSMYREDRRSQPRRVNYAALDVEELGSVYESLLDLQPAFAHENGRLVFRFRKGTERKTTGSYYTHPELVEELIKSALVPVIEDRLRSARTREEKERAILEITVCDPACGSGHFLLAAARRLARELARIRSGEDEPSPREYRLALRDVITHCIYGVDKNPLAVELCKVALWLESHAEGKPLSFLDHRILCGDSLVGVHDLSVLRKGIPAGAYKPVTGDDPDVAREVQRRNREALRGQRWLPLVDREEVRQLTEARRELLEIPDDSPEEIRRKRQAFDRWRSQGGRYWRDRMAADLWTAAFFLPLTEKNLADRSIPTTEELWDYLEGRSPVGQILGAAHGLSMEHWFFHWPLEFPEVFARGGFDVILCNPPWERIKLQQQEFFATRDPQIAGAPNKAARERLIRELPSKKPALWQEYQEALHRSDALSKYLRESGLYPLTARGDINTYSVFAERFTRLVRPQGRVGVVLPTGIATDDTNKAFFENVAAGGRLVSLYDFENREGLFPAIDSRMKFSLVTLRGGPAERPEPAQFAFFLTRSEQLRDPRRTFALTSKDFALLNPNTRTCPVFRTRADAELTRYIYQRVPVLANLNSNEPEDGWGIAYRVRRFFDMNKSDVLARCRRTKPPEAAPPGWYPVYEAKMIHQYDHRFGDYADQRPGSKCTELPKVALTRLNDPEYRTTPRYWIPVTEVESRLADLWHHSWLLVWRDVTNATNERSLIAAVIPLSATDFTLRVGLPDEATLVPLLLAVLNSIVLDYCLRNKIGGTHLADFVFYQLPVPNPSSFQIPCPWEPLTTAAEWVRRAVVELTYTSSDLTPFARDFGYNGPPFPWDPERRARLRAELDAYFAKLYGLNRKQLRYILDPADLTPREIETILDDWEEVEDPLDPAGYEQRVKESTFPGETFRVLKQNEIRRYGEYRTRRLVLEAWQRLWGT